MNPRWTSPRLTDSMKWFLLISLVSGIAIAGIVVASALTPEGKSRAQQINEVSKSCSSGSNPYVEFSDEGHIKQFLCVKEP